MPKRKIKRVAMGKQRRGRNNKIRIEVIALLIIAAGLFLGVSLFTDTGGIFGGFLKNSIMGLMSIFIYPVPFIIIAYGINYIIKKGEFDYAYKYGLVFNLIVMVQAFTHIFAHKPEASMTFGNILKFSYIYGVDGEGGGLFGALISEPIINMFGPVGAGIVFILSSIILIIFITDISLIKIFGLLGELIIKAYSHLRVLFSKDNSNQSKFEKQANNINKKSRGNIFTSKGFDIAEDKAEVENVANIVTDEKKAKVEEDLFDSLKVIDHLSKPGKIEAEKQIEIDDFVKESDEKKAELGFEGQENVIELGSKMPFTEHIEYKFPPTDFLANPSNVANKTNDTLSLKNSAKKLTETLKSFGVEAKVIQVSRGPSVTRFELQPSVGVKVSKIVNLSDDIALNLAASGVRIEAPIPGKAAIGIEIANDEIMPVLLREVIESDEFKHYPSKLAFSIGKDITGKPVVADIAKMPHLLIAGATGSGKSVCINSLITSILYKANPNEVKLVMIDPKVVELGVYNGVPHLLIPVVTDPKKAASALNWAVQEMVRRYKLFADNNVRDLAGFNAMVRENIDDLENEDKQLLPQIIVIIDELADLMMVSPGDVENAICRLAQMARAAGMHLVIATQRPSVDVITGVIKANIPSRISFAVSSQIDSRTILDMAGAEKLLGRGDMLFMPVGAPKPVRLQGAYISDKEVENIVRYIKENTSARYNNDIIEHLQSENDVEEFDPGDNDELLPKAIEIVVESGQASISMLQRRLRLGYARAARMIDQMEARGIIGGYEGSKPRQILITKEQYHEMLLSSEN